MISAKRHLAQLKAELFKTLGHPVRVQVLEQLRGGECSVGKLAEVIGSELSSLSQQLGVLRRAGVVVTRREGNSIYYALGDPSVTELLDAAQRMLVANLQDSRSLLLTIQEESQ